MRVRVLLLLAFCAMGTACSTRTSAEAPAADAGPLTTPADPIAMLQPFEAETRRTFDLAKPPSAETGLGADPWALRHVPGGFVGILRGRAAVVLLDEELRELARLPAPRSPTGLALTQGGEVLVVGELSPVVARYAVHGQALTALAESRVPGVLGLRDVAVSPAGAVWVIDERGARVLRVGTTSAVATIAASVPVGHGAAQLLATSKHVLASTITEHAIVTIEVDASGAPLARDPVRLTNDGPLWGFDAKETEHGLLVVAGGVEDHPLDRRQGFFGYVDSFVHVFRDGKRFATVNVAEHGVVTPKAIAIDAAVGDHLELLVTGYGSAQALRLTFEGTAVSTAPLALVPGTRSMDRSGARTVLADPLLDAWVLLDERGVHVVPVADAPPRPVASRLGEALFFTSLMGPTNATKGALSRFTCETCHFEGYVDGRTHHTGREEIHATTKPLVGLVGNRPYFSRALDPDLSTVAHAEFRVAGAGNPADPFFAIDPRDHAWLAELGVQAPVAALELRRSLMRFLTDFSHRPNPAVIGRTSFTSQERAGAAAFRDRCERCHAARLSADDAATRVAFEQWEPMILNEAAPIVWGSAGYQKTGVLPYVHEDGARTPSLRRLYKKYPYLTNGSAHSLGAVLDAFATTPAATFHANAPSDGPGPSPGWTSPVVPPAIRPFRRCPSRPAARNAGCGAASAPGRRDSGSAGKYPRSRVPWRRPDIPSAVQSPSPHRSAPRSPRRAPPG